VLIAIITLTGQQQAIIESVPAFVLGQNMILGNRIMTTGIKLVRSIELSATTVPLRLEYLVYDLNQLVFRQAQSAVW